MNFQYGIDDHPGWKKLLLFSLQWLVVSIPPIIIIGRIIPSLQNSGIDPVVYLQKLFLITAIIMLAQVLLGHRLPLVVGPATVLLIGILASTGRTSAAINSAVIIGGVLLALLGITGLFSYLKRLFTPRVIAVILMLIAFTLSPTILQLMLGEPAVGHANLTFAILLTLAIFVAHRFLTGIWKSTLAVWAMLAGSLLFYGLFGTGSQFGDNLAALAVPSFGLPALALPDAGMLLAFLFCFLALAVNDLGSIQSVGVLLNADKMDERITRGVSITGLGNILSGLAGIIGPVNFSLSPGIIASTGCASRFALVPAAIALLGLAFSPLAIGIMGSIPPPVIGAVLLQIMTAQIAASLMLIRETQATKSFNDGLIIGLPLMLGTIVSFLPPDVVALFPAGLRPVITNGFVVGVFTVLLLAHCVYSPTPEP
ncbi:MAG: solute carrier family 23 protein [Heliobacteriaceae bacterium]|nr:solute carrier family 23 protein [Heliobacteriaceae bacterium]